MARRPASERLLRLLALPAWVAENPGASLAQAAAHFEVDARTIARDINTLWVSGLPGGMPDALVDFDAEAMERGRLRLTQPLGLDRPVRLTREEAVALLLALRVLAGLLDADDAARAPIARATRALSGLLSTAEGDGCIEGAESTESDGAGGSAAPRVGAPVMEAVKRALSRGLRLDLDYVSATDTRSRRSVDPIELVSDGSHLALLAWCTRARAERSFRLDRILSARCTPQAAAPHRRLRRPALDDPRSGTDGQVAIIELAPTGRWLVEQVPTRSVEEREDGSLRVEVLGRDRQWLVGLVLSAGRHVRAVEPPELAAQCAAAARAALAAEAGVHGGPQ